MKTRCRRPILMFLALLGWASLAVSAGSPTFAEDNTLTAEEEAEGWILLFNGEDLEGWKNNNDKPLADGVVQDGSINPHGAGGYLVVYDQEFGDFVFKCDVKMAQPTCNSGVFLRVSDLKDPIYTGLEVQVLSGSGSTNQDFGAIYDLVAPKKNAAKGPGEWDSLEIRCEGPIITVKVNGELVTEMDCDEFDKPGLRPDGSKHKFRRAIKDFARSGYIGLQDHDWDVWYKNIKLLELDSE